MSAGLIQLGKRWRLSASYQRYYKVVLKIALIVKTALRAPHLVQVGVGDLLQRLDLVDRENVRIHVHKLNLHLFKRPQRQQMPLDARQSLVWIVIRL